MDKRVLVTGAAGALGRVVIKFLVERGYEILGIDLAPPDPIAGIVGLSRVDLGDEVAVRDFFERLARDRVRLLAVINLAGGFDWETIEDGSVETWDRLYRMNLRTALLTSQAALPLLANGSSIINVSAMASHKADAGMGAYAASKAGVSRLTESLAAELKDRGIRVNALLPSIIDTPANRSQMPDADFDQWVTPSALAEVIAFLLSHGARAITGALIPVAGRL